MRAGAERKVRRIARRIGEARRVESLGIGPEVSVAMEHVRADVDNRSGRNAKTANLILRDPAPTVGVAKLADSAVTLSIGPWVKVPDYGAAVGEVNQAVLRALGERGIGIPYPQREIRVVSEAVLRQGAEQRLAG
jgi:small conductance mechanosensitive channel